MARSASQPVHVAQFNQVTHQVWTNRLEQAPGPQEFWDGRTLGTCNRTLHRHFDVLSVYRWFDVSDVFVAASARLGCARVSR